MENKNTENKIMENKINKNKINYDLVMDNQIKNIKADFPDRKPALLLHTCCAPCCVSVLEFLKDIFDITLYFYNPNITDEHEYLKRYNELCTYVNLRNYTIKIINGLYSPEKDFFPHVKGLENEKEGGGRCFVCYNLRLEETARLANTMKFDYFSTVLSISPLKNSKIINELGEKLEKLYKVKFLYGDFKKKNRFLESIKISKEFDLYRQNFCGCCFSKI
jgi:predicted adenine nucleotide alpha hydrolase (AANH) superfamily ATPase